MRYPKPVNDMNSELNTPESSYSAPMASVGDAIPPNWELIEVRVTELRLLFNPIDPSPPAEKDLEAKAEEFIVAWARSAKRARGPRLKIDVDKPALREEASTVGAAVHEFFRQRSLSSDRRLSRLLWLG